MRELAKNKMVNGLQYDWKQELAFCECCVQGKSHQLPFPQSTAKRASHPLDLIHSDVCGKNGTQSLGGGGRILSLLWMNVLDMCGYIS